MPFTDYLKSLRYNQIFGDGSFPTNPTPMQHPMMSPDVSTPPFIPEHQASDYLNSLLTQFPERGNPSMLAKIFAGIAGVGGPSSAPTQDAILNGDFNDKMKDWNTKASIATGAASAERGNNTIARTAYDQGRSRDIQQQRADTYGTRTGIADREQQSKDEARQAKIDIDKRKQDLAEFKSKNPKYIYKTDAKGKIFAFNPENPSEMPKDTGISSGDLGEIEKHNLRLDEIHAQGEETRTTKETPGAQPTKEPTTTKVDTTSNGPNGQTVTSRTTTSGPSNKVPSGKKVKMVGPNGEGPYMIPIEKVAESKSKYKMKEAQ